MERLRTGSYCSPECKADAKQKEDQLALESLSLFGPRKAVKEPEKPKAVAKKEQPAEPPDPPFGEPVKQVAPSSHDCPLRAAGFPKWVAPPPSAKKKSIEDYRPVSRVPDEVMMEQERLLMAGVMWVACQGENPDNADGYRSDFRYMLAVPQVELPRRKRELGAETLCEIEEPAARHCESPGWTGLELTPYTLLPAVRPRLNAAVMAPDWEAMAQPQQPPQQQPELEAPPPQPAAPKRPKVDAHRIATSFPAMMQAGLVRVEPGFATAVLELRPVAPPPARQVDPAMAGIAGTVASPQYADGMPSALRHGAAQRMEAGATQGFYSLRQVEEIPETLLATTALPPFFIRKLSSARVRPEVRVPLRYLPMPHFQLPCAAADWSS
ncbi:MAG: hypothetical protein U0R19_36165 [Bryobacteraceae bacterium]